TAATLLVTAGDNPERLRSEASFAHLCGVAPIPASSGKTTRHRLNRGGDRQANRALHMLAVRRIAWDPATRAYVERRTAEGLSKPEILRCLQRYIACAVQAHRHPPRFTHIVPPGCLRDQATRRTAARDDRRRAWAR